MKIALDISAFNNKSTGTVRYINCLREQLGNFEHKIIEFPVNNSRLRKNIFIRNYYKNFKNDREILNQNPDCGIFPNYFIPSKFTKPSAIVIHDLSFISHPQFYSKGFVYYYSCLLKNTLKKNPLILTVSRHSKNQIVKNLNIKEENIFLLQAYFDFKIKNYFSEKFENIETPYFLYVGHIEPRKNLLFLVESFLKWNEKNDSAYKLKIVGELWIKSNETKILLKKYKNNPAVEFTGYVDEQTLHKTYKNALAFVHTSFEEGFGFPILEAMHYDLPVLCSDVHAAKEISNPYSITINPYKEKSLINGFDLLHEKIQAKKKEKYFIKYTPELMRKQLEYVLNTLEEKTHNDFSISISKANYIEEAIEKTLLYSALFNSGIKKDLLHQFLFDVKIEKSDLKKNLIDLYIQNKIIIDGDYLYLNFKLKTFYKKHHVKLNSKKVKKSLFILNHIPFISGIFFSGGTANYGIENHNDIDLFIITKPNAVYLVYFFIHIFSKIFNIRNDLCANYLIDENNLEITQKDYYTAHQIVSLKAMRNAKALNYFLFKNDWVKKIFPNYDLIIPIKNKAVFKRVYSLLIPLNKIIKNFYKFLYRDYLKKFSDSVLLNDNCLKLHTNDHRMKTLKNFDEEWKRYKSEKNSEAYIKVFN